MPPAIVAETFLHRHDNQLTAVLTLVLTAVLVWLVNRAFSGRAARLAEVAVGRRDGLSREADTRLRFTRRLVDAVIVVLGVAIALSEFDALDQIGHTLLASGAIVAAITGFAARPVLGNAVAGLMLAVTQPLRVGDSVVFGDQAGIVEDVKLTATWLRSPADARLVIPNELLASSVLRNDSIVTATIATEAELWLPHARDTIGAVDAIRAALPEVTVRVSDSNADGVRLLLVGEPAAPHERPVRQAELREAALRAVASQA